MDIGRVDLAHSLKQYFELAGQMKLSLGEGIVPTAQVADLAGSPFSLDLPFVGLGMQAGVAAEYSIFIVRPTGLPQNAWLTVDRIMTYVAAGQIVYIEPYKLTSAPALTAGGVVRAMRRALLDSSQPGLPEADMLGGTSAAAPPTTIGWEVVESTLSSRETIGPWHITAGGALVIWGNTLNAFLHVALRGRVHFTSSK